MTSIASTLWTQLNKITPLQLFISLSRMSSFMWCRAFDIIKLGPYTVVSSTTCVFVWEPRRGVQSGQRHHVSLLHPHVIQIDGKIILARKSYWASTRAKLSSCLAGMVQAWVAHFVTPLKCMYDEYDWQVTSQKPHKKLKSPNKHHHHGVGAACPSSGVDMMNPCHLRGGQPCAC